MKINRDVIVTKIIVSQDFGGSKYSKDIKGLGETSTAKILEAWVGSVQQFCQSDYTNNLIVSHRFWRDSVQQFLQNNYTTSSSTNNLIVLHRFLKTVITAILSNKHIKFALRFKK